MKKTTSIFIVLMAIVLIGASCTQKQTSNLNTEAVMMKVEPTEDTMMKGTDETMEKEMMEMIYQFIGNLVDVTLGKTITGINTGNNATGVAQANFEDNTYSLLATFENLPDPKGTDFYEGWVVRKSPFDVISTGKIEKKNGVYTNMYSSGQDLTDHDFYVLTIEPNDGDPAPAEHILEGTMAKTAPEAMTAEIKTIDISGTNYTFSLEEIRVKKGDKVKIVFTSNDGFHDWTVDEFDAATSRVNTGSTASVEFVADKTGTFEYYCSVGNHRQLGMVGNLIVE